MFSKDFKQHMEAIEMLQQVRERERGAGWEERGRRRGGVTRLKRAIRGR